MALEPVNHVLTALRQTQWQQQRQFDRLVQVWAKIVGPTVAAQTQPLQISAQRVLLIATASAVWAQNLVFERQRILTKLNAMLDEPLTDIRFSTSQWRDKKARKQPIQTSWTPKTLVPKPRSQPPAPSADLTPNHQQAFKQWSQVVRSQAHRNPPCPQCQCATPIAELQRWSVCSLCWVRLPRNDSPSTAIPRQP